MTAGGTSKLAVLASAATARFLCGWRDARRILYELELLEEGLISRAHSDGLVDILRRPDASPSAVLVVVVVKVKTEAAA